jgi:TonB-linked SusC/RagA family outer membrane protein
MRKSEIRESKPLSKMKRNVLLVMALLLGCGWAMAQRQVTGMVTAKEDNSPLPGVNIVIKGTGMGTVTNVEGKYLLEVSDTSVLVFSFLGFKDYEITVGSQTEINVALENDAEVLSEVVVTALGIEQEKKKLGFTAAQLNNTDLTQGRNPNILASLQGKIAGANITIGSGAPGASTRIVLRGDARLGGSQPLIVIDGVPMANNSYGSSNLNGGSDLGNGLNAINPEDIEDINIVQGGAGTALYGSQGATGVVFITTKKGKKGRPRVDLTAGVNFENILKLPNYQNQFGQGFFGEEVLDENTSWGPEFNGQLRLWGRKVNNQQQLKPYKALPNNVKDFFETGVIRTYTAAVSGASDNTSYYLSYGFAGHDGILPSGFDSYKRHTISARTETKLSSRLTSSFSFNYARTNQGYSPTGQGSSVLNQILQTPRDISIVDLKDINNQFNDINGFYNSYAINPWLVLKKFGINTDIERYYGNFFVKYKINDWMSFNTRLGTDIQTLTTKNWAPILAPVTPNSANTNPGSLTESVLTDRIFNSDVFLSINRKLTADLALDVIAGFNVRQTQSSALSSSVSTLLIPEFYNLSNSTERPTSSQSISKRRNGAGYLSAEFGYKGFLFLTATGRYDLSSTLPAGNNSYWFYGLSSGFVFSDVLHLDDTYFSYGKLRLATSKTGIDAAAYLVKPVFVSGGHSDGFTSLTYPLPNGVQAYEVGNTIGNAALRPEFVTTNEAGVDLRFFKNKVGFDITVYNRKTTDLILSRLLPGSSGYSSLTTNSGEVENRGVEFLLRVTPIRKRGFRWDISLNYSRNRNKLLSLPDGQAETQIGGLSSIGFFAIPGQPLGVYRGNVPQYTPDGKLIVDPATGYPVISPNKGILGNAQVNYIAGLTNQFAYKNISLSFTVDTRRGGLLFSRNVDLHHFSGTAIATTYNNRLPFIIPNSVVANSDGTYSPNTTPIGHHVGGDLQTFWDQGGMNLDKSFMIPRDFIKLREVVLTYTLPNKWLKKTPLRDAAFSFTGRNLLIWVPIENQFQDPEATTFGTGIESSFGDFGAQPTTRNWGFNFRVSF